ncbi:MAG: hypothetical protein AAF547_06650 [Actinomycetota bacterium]
MLSTKPIDTRHLTFRYSGAAGHYEYDRDTEKRAREQTMLDGVPVWKIRCVAVYRSAGEHGEITVTVPHPIEPAAEFDSEISFSEMTVKDWSINGTQGQTWHAESFTAAAPTVAPSKRRTAESPALAS